MLPIPLTGRVFTRDEAVRAGVSDRTLQRLRAAGVVRHLGYATWCDAALPSAEELWLEAVVAVAPYAVASHATAARLWGADHPDRRLHVTVPAARPLRSASGLVVHRDGLSRSEVAVRHGLPVTDAYRAAIDVARTAGRRTSLGVEVVDALLVSEQIEREQLAARIARMPSRPGIVAARRVADLSRYGAQSPAETRLRLLLAADGVPEPRLQHRIRCRGGLVVADLCWPRERLVVEYDGFGPHTERATFERDRRRWGWLRADGWELRVYTAEALRDRPHEVRSEVHGLLLRSARAA